MKYEVLKWIRDANAADLADIAVRVCAINPDVFLQAVEESGTSFDNRTYVVQGQVRTINAKDLDKLVACGDGPDKKIACIKLARELLDLGLKDAKDLIEHMMEEGTLAKVRRPPDPPYTRSWEHERNYDEEQRATSLAILLNREQDDRQTY